jgi:hypothetical protein
MKGGIQNSEARIQKPEARRKRKKKNKIYRSTMVTAVREPPVTGCGNTVLIFFFNLQSSFFN